MNDSAVKVLGDETLRTIAQELVETVRRNVTIDWTVKESVRAKLRTKVKRILRKYGYPQGVGVRVPPFAPGEPLRLIGAFLASTRIVTKDTIGRRARVL